MVTSSAENIGFPQGRQGAWIYLGQEQKQSMDREQESLLRGKLLHEEEGRQDRSSQWSFWRRGDCRGQEKEGELRRKATGEYGRGKGPVSGPQLLRDEVQGSTEAWEKEQREIQRANFQSAAPMLERSPTKDQQFPGLNKTQSFSYVGGKYSKENVITNFKANYFSHKLRKGHSVSCFYRHRV